VVVDLVYFHLLIWGEKVVDLVVLMLVQLMVLLQIIIEVVMHKLILDQVVEVPQMVVLDKVDMVDQVLF
tara:strand:- start:115 stop:321 length:207 start_codon:yes stop_codon:yes gene_type:complete